MKKNIYIFTKYIGWFVIFLFLLLYFLLYFYPSLDKINNKKNQLKNNKNIIKKYREQIEAFQPPNIQGKKLWNRINQNISKTNITLKSKQEYLEFVYRIMQTIKNTAVVNLDDILIQVRHHGVSLTQTLRGTSELHKVFPKMKESKKDLVQNNKKFVTYKSKTEEKKTKKNKIEKFNLQLLFPGDLKKSSQFLINLHKNLKNYSIDKIKIKKENNKVYYLIELGFKINRTYKNA